VLNVVRSLKTATFVPTAQPNAREFAPSVRFSLSALKAHLRTSRVALRIQFSLSS
jgi:hypothetical protein